VFTKCKESLHDGRRLENISWRLWYREMATSSSAARPGENDGWNEEAYLDEKMGDDVLSSTRDETLPVLPSTPHISGKSPPFFTIPLVLHTPLLDDIS
jgi:hypothetical protein